MTATSPAAELEGPALYDPRERTENFPVAMRLLPPAVRRQLRQIYVVARHIDDLGDEAPGDRGRLLAEFRKDLDTLFDGGTPRDPCLRQFIPTPRAGDLQREALQRLVDANLQDQQVHEYATFEDLLGYCRLSADPIGRMVLAAFGQSTTERQELSDRICSALQVLEHCQDVVEDFHQGRLYLPQVDLSHAGCPSADILNPRQAGALRAVVLVQVRRARHLMQTGQPLIGELHGWARIAVAGYLAGGMATADALEHARGDVTRSTPRPRRVDLLRHVLVLLMTRRGSA
ncbi:squalene/phytoene synthase family protein [Leekyejoonella antrihumi]|uniref:Squalene synthase HpnC n=1 Tax=Leekyejoonella antrihumi TaxID=1660198 RepID=A0A563E589_9MICO|nr:squalene/phytoene synthase family protein [Leekyejoonella antrihumi]TWP37676.1 squalene synthase HpnC [Leekyejoonella antrihumi]